MTADLMRETHAEHTRTNTLFLSHTHIHTPALLGATEARNMTADSEREIHARIHTHINSFSHAHISTPALLGETEARMMTAD